MLKFLCNPYGRISRFSYIVKFMFPLNLALAIARVSDAMRTVNTKGELSALGLIAGPAVYFVLLIFAWPVVAVSIRRLHDLGHSGYWVLMPLICLAVLFLDGSLLFNTPEEIRDMFYGDAKYTFLAAIVPVGIFLVYMNAGPGEEGDNIYGEDPIRHIADTEFLRARRLRESEQLAE